MCAITEQCSTCMAPRRSCNRHGQMVLRPPATEEPHPRTWALPGRAGVARSRRGVSPAETMCGRTDMRLLARPSTLSRAHTGGLLHTACFRSASIHTFHTGTHMLARPVNGYLSTSDAGGAYKACSPLRQDPTTWSQSHAVLTAQWLSRPHRERNRDACAYGAGGCIQDSDSEDIRLERTATRTAQ